MTPPWLFPGVSPPADTSQPAASARPCAPRGPPPSPDAATWTDLVRDAAPQVLARALGISPTTAMHYAARAGADWTSYAGCRKISHHHAAAIGYARLALLASGQGQYNAALNHLDTAAKLGSDAPDSTTWLVTIEIATHAVLKRRLYEPPCDSCNADCTDGEAKTLGEVSDLSLHAMMVVILRMLPDGLSSGVRDVKRVQMLSDCSQVSPILR